MYAETFGITQLNKIHNKEFRILVCVYNSMSIMHGVRVFGLLAAMWWLIPALDKVNNYGSDQ